MPVPNVVVRDVACGANHTVRKTPTAAKRGRLPWVVEGGARTISEHRGTHEQGAKPPN